MHGPKDQGTMCEWEKKGSESVKDALTIGNDDNDVRWCVKLKGHTTVKCKKIHK